MPLQAAKAFFTVTAGIIPHDVMPEYSRSWCYTSGDYDTDRQTATHKESIFRRYQSEAEEYARSITDPARVNWVRCDFLWV